MITITDATGHSLTLDDVEMTSAEIGRMIEDWKQEHHPEPASFTFDRAGVRFIDGGISCAGTSNEHRISVAIPDDIVLPIRFNTTQMQTFDGREVHAPAPTSARWEGPPPKRRGRR